MHTRSLLVPSGLLLAAVAGMMGCAGRMVTGPTTSTTATPIVRTPFGNSSNPSNSSNPVDAQGKPVDLYTLTNAHGLLMKVTTFGGIITEMHVPDRHGKLADVVLGFDDPASYQRPHPFFGALVGRVANRIRGAQFELDGTRFELAANNGAHALHGGKRGWDKSVWTAEPMQTARGSALKLTHTSPGGDEGYPGTVSATTTYTLTNDDQLVIEMTATTDAPTLVNMAQHTYWNLGGHGAGSVLDHQLTLHASQYTPGDPVVPTGEVRAVAGTPFDFTRPKAIGQDLRQIGNEPVGYDHNFVIDGVPGQLRPVARVEHPASGRVMTVDSDQPGVQFYSGNFLNGSLSGKGATYPQHSGFCLETQGFPNAINVPAWRDQVILRPGQTYRHTLIFTFQTNPAAR